METRHDVIVQAAQLADELGYEAFAVPEGWALDSTPLLAELARRTRRITLVSAVLSVWGRTPATLAMTAATLYRLAQGRYVLGLGTSTEALVEGFHDVAFEQPADKLREVTTKVRELLAGERARLDNTAAARPLRLGLPPVPELPIWLAAMGERTSRVAAELGDGWIPVFVSPTACPGGRRSSGGPAEPPVCVPGRSRWQPARGPSPTPTPAPPGPWWPPASPGTCRPWATSPAARWDRPSRGPSRGRRVHRPRDTPPGPRAARALGQRDRPHLDRPAAGHGLGRCCGDAASRRAVTRRATRAFGGKVVADGVPDPDQPFRHQVGSEGDVLVLVEGGDVFTRPSCQPASAREETST
jgi:hypothetical protein